MLVPGLPEGAYRGADQVGWALVPTRPGPPYAGKVEMSVLPAHHLSVVKNRNISLLASGPLPSV